MVLENFQKFHDNGTTTVTQSKVARPTVVRKKFAKPPVKVACLAWYVIPLLYDSGHYPGGQRPVFGIWTTTMHRSCFKDTLRWTSSLFQSPGFDESTGMFGQIDGLSVPGAGLRSLDFPSDVQSMFADLFIPHEAGHPPAQMEPTPSPSNISTQSLVRTYGSEHDILNAYYDFIHHYFPILPPRAAPASPDRPLDAVGSYSESPTEEPLLLYRPRSPLSLALSAVLALIPHPSDLEPSSPASVIRRRTYAHTFSQLANSSIETDCELHASSTDPAQALSSERPLINRENFHPHTPVELESILALLVLSVYEYTQRGNLLKMRYRAGQALAIALDMSLHSLGEEYDEFAEARRRAWWMTGRLSAQQ
ncbi:C6 zinc finger domain protein [Aspergillus bombycis]|uniref:C6 zinc finger domain protein n=1 Tax=Aspergillus bombycis TaxID=109264 RepID=A0A1F7ZVN0_9EURO|nr:C6 zinc finger domain protein [Aspergillus bombycis]OGM43477.1 C6 zinc finger domain protein [Aspergillus bombycis]